MKKLINKLLAAILFLGVVGYAQAEEWKTYKFTDPEKRNTPHPDVIKLEKGDKVDFVNMITSHLNASYLELEIDLDDDIRSQMAYYATSNLKSNGAHQIVQNFVTLYGPCTLKFFGMMWKTSSNPSPFVMCNVKITRAHELKGNNLTGYSLVLPESTDTSYKLLLESSTDLVDWKADNTGSKAPSDRKRFYRLRAVKE
jgi:plastocyanin